MLSDSPSSRRVRWSERWERPGWQLYWTTAGGRFREDDLVSRIRPGARERVERVISQACFAVSADAGGAVDDPSVGLWVAVARKVLQRGSRPPVSRLAEEIIRGSAAVPGNLGSLDIERAATAVSDGWVL